MCGIAGIYNFDEHRNVSSEILKSMTNIIAHRGPDGEAYHIKNNLGLGHRRLAIIDLQNGDQPIYNKDKSIVIVFNGEIYNYIELREELRILGHTFSTNSDTEVIVYAYQQWGPNCLEKLNGMWAFALWDDRNDTLFLSRDRLGEKPLYYSMRKDMFLFGSEIKSLLQYPIDWPKDFSPLEIYLNFGYCPAPFTFYKDISELEPGNYMIVKVNHLKKYKYWDLPDITENEMKKDKKNIHFQFNKLLYNSTKIRMRSDVPYGSFLSGGLDSSTIVSIMTSLSEIPVESFTMGFGENAFDERRLARIIAKKFGTNHNEQLIKKDSLQKCLNRVIYHCEQPFGDATAIAIDYLSRYVKKKGIKMILTGDGGDEVLSGYTSYKGMKFDSTYKRLPFIIKTSLLHSFKLIKRLLPSRYSIDLNRIIRILTVADYEFTEKIVLKRSWLKDKWLLDNLLQNVKNLIPIKDYMSELMKPCRFKKDFYKLMYFDLKSSLPGDHLTKIDRMTMANSLEARTPFLDYRLVEYMYGVDKSIKMEGWELKSILRNEYGRILPKMILKAPKWGFGIPVTEWFKDETFSRQFTKLEGIESIGLNQNAISSIVERNKENINDYGIFLWMLLVLNRWVLN